MDSQKLTPRIIGAGIIVLGLMLLAELLNIVRDNTVYDIIWPFAVFLTGMSMLGTKAMRMYGYLILWLGFLLLLRQLHVFDSDAGKTILIFVLAATGLGALTLLGDMGISKKSSSDS